MVSTVSGLLAGALALLLALGGGFMMLVALNGFSGSSGGLLLAGYALLAVAVIAFCAGAAAWLAHFFSRRGLSPWLGAPLAVSAASGGGLVVLLGGSFLLLLLGSAL